MTVLGKILAVVNLVLSAGVLVFIVANYVARTNWHDAYLMQKKINDQSKQDSEAFKRETSEISDNLKKTREDMTAAQIASANQKKALEDKLATQTAVREKEKKVFEEKLVELTKSTEELKSRTSEVTYLKDLLGRRESDLIKKEEQVQTYRNRMVEAEIASKSQQERNELLLMKNETLQKDVKKATTSGGAGGINGYVSKKNPPDEDVHGTIKSASPDGLVTLSIGSDAGLKKGHTLEVFRLRPQEKYLGTIEILDVNPNEAVAKPLSRLLGSILVGDIVARDVSARR